jgi:hypothetical protein
VSEAKGVAARALSATTLALGVLTVLSGFWFLVEIFLACEVGEGAADLLMWRVAPALGVTCVGCFAAAQLTSRKTPVATIWSVLRWSGLVLGLLGVGPCAYACSWMFFGPPL